MKSLFRHSVVVLSVLTMLSCSSRAQETGLMQPAEMADYVTNTPCQLIEHVGYTVCYNTKWHIPNWVAYEFTYDEVNGDIPRKGNDVFMHDPQAKGTIVNKYDYSKSGYDRGHMAPAGDMKWDKKAMTESFYLSNICPQTHSLNDGDWRILEERIRAWVRKYGTLYIVCGPLISDNPQTIANGKIAVPYALFKVILRKKGDGYEAIGFVFKNDETRGPLSSYAVSVDYVEELTKIDFFSPLPDEAEEQAECDFNLSSWGLR